MNIVLLCILLKYGVQIQYMLQVLSQSITVGEGVEAAVYVNVGVSVEAAVYVAVDVNAFVNADIRA